MMFLLKSTVFFVMLSLGAYADRHVTASAVRQQPQGLMNQESLKTAYVYLNWYVNELQKNKLTDAQKKQLEDLKKQVDASMAVVSEGESVDAHQLLQKLGELEHTLGVIASTLNIAPPPAVFCGVKPMQATQLSVRAGHQRLKEFKDDMPQQKEPAIPTAISSAPEFDSDED